MTVRAQRTQTPAPAGTQAQTPAPKAPDPSGGRGNDAVADIVAKSNKPTGPRKLDPKKTGIVHFGLNKGAKSESMALNKANRDDGGAYSIRDQGSSDAFKDGKVTYDLGTPESAATFTSTLGMSNPKAVATAKFLGDPKIDPRVKDELAHLVKVLSQAETGEREIKRLVLSGHSMGTEIWGDDNGLVTMEQLQKLVELFPNARKGVDHLMMSACSSGGELAHEGYRKMFPDLESSVGYRGSSPGTYVGGLKHLKSWEAATEKGKKTGGVDPDLAKGMRKGDVMTTWNKEDGFHGTAAIDTELQLNRWYDYDGGDYKGLFNGTLDSHDPDHHTSLRAQYDRGKALSQNPNVPEVDRPYYNDQANAALRLLKYDKLKKKYMKANRVELEGLYKEAGEELPNFGKLSRADTVKHVEGLESSFPKSADGQIDFDNFSDADNKRYDAWVKVYGLYSLNKEALPEEWI